MSVTKEDVDIREMYEEQSTLNKDEFIKKYNIEKDGLSNIGVNNARKKYGLNEIKQAKPKKWYNYLFEGLFTPFNCILLVISIVLCYTDIYLPKSPSYANIIVIIILVLASTLLDFFEEYRSNKAAEKLKAMVATNTTVIRNGKKIQIPIKNVVTGDTVIWFTFSIVSNLVGMHIIRTRKIPFIQSNANIAVYLSSALLIIVGIIIPATPLGSAIGLVPLAGQYVLMIFGVTFMYCILASFVKKMYIKKYEDWI